MVDPNLTNYIKSSKSQGASDGVIKQALLNAGWQEQQISDAFSLINLQDAPSPPAPSHAYQPPSANPQPQAIRRTAKRSEPRPPKLTSPYSSLLSVVLFVSLMILMNNLIYDLVKFVDPNVSGGAYFTSFSSGKASMSLTVSSFVIVPFWFITFLLNHFYREKRKRLGVLLMPYYITSGWLLVWLLFQVGFMLLNSDATFGVYFVLILLGAVLTGVTWAFQRYKSTDNAATVNQQ